MNPAIAIERPSYIVSARGDDPLGVGVVYSPLENGAVEVHIAFIWSPTAEEGHCFNLHVTIRLCRDDSRVTFKVRQQSPDEQSELGMRRQFIELRSAWLELPGQRISGTLVGTSEGDHSAVAAMIDGAAYLMLHSLAGGTPLEIGMRFGADNAERVFILRAPVGQQAVDILAHLKRWGIENAP
jgi:hypothetical protein